MASTSKSPCTSDGILIACQKLLIIEIMPLVFFAAWATILLTFTYIGFSYVIAYRRLNHIPGPHLAAWSNIWWVQAAVSKRSHLKLHQVCKQYGVFCDQLMSATVLK